MACPKYVLISVGFLIFWFCLPATVLGQEQMPNIQVHTGEGIQAFSNSDSPASEKRSRKFLSYSLEVSVVQEESSHPTATIGTGRSDSSPHGIPVQNVSIDETDSFLSIFESEEKRLQDLQQMIQGARNSVTVLEGNSRTFEVDLDSEPSGSVTVTIAGGNTKLTVSPKALTFTPSNWNVRQPVTVTANQDPGEENDQVTLTMNASSGTANPSTVKVTIIDDESPWRRPPVSIQEGGRLSFGIPLLEVLAPPSGDVTFVVTGHEDTVLRPIPTKLTFPVNAWRVEQTLALTTELDEDVVDNTVTLTLTASGGGYSGLKYLIEVTVIDRPPQEVLIMEGDSIDLRFSLKGGNPGGPRRNQIATFDQYDDTDLTVNPKQLVFKVEDWHSCLHQGRPTICSGAEMTRLRAIHDEDAVDDQNIMRLTITGPPGADYLGVSRLIYVRIEDDDDPGLVIDPLSLEIDEGASGVFTVKLSDPPLGDFEDNDVTVAIPPSVGDLTSNKTRLTFTASNWDEEQTVTLMAGYDDDLVNDVDTLWLAANGGGYDRERGRVIVTVKDDGLPEIVVTPSSVEVNEGSSETVEVKLGGQPSGEVTVMMTWPAETDLNLRPAIQTFTPANWNEGQEVTLTADEDDDFVNDQVVVTLTGNGGGFTGVTNSILVTIIDNDTEVQKIIVAEEEVTMDEGSTYPFNVRLSAKPSETVTLRLTGYAGTDLRLDQSSLAFTTTNWQNAQIVTFTAEKDEDYDDDELELLLSASGGGYDDVTHTTKVTIIDEGPLTISISDAQVLEDAGNLQLPIELNRPAEEVVTVQYESSDRTAEAGLDYTASRGIVIFDPGATRGVVEIEITDDERLEAEEEFAVTLLNARQAVIADGKGTGIGTILDNDGSAKLRIDDILVMEEEGIVQFRVSLSHPQREMVTAAYRTRDGTARAGEDYEATSGMVTLAPGTTEALIAVRLLKEDPDREEETFTVHLESAKHAGIEKAVGVATIQELMAAGKKVLDAYAARFVRTASMQVVDALGGRFRRAADGAMCAAAERAEMAQLWYSASSWDPSLGELLAGCRMSQSMPLSSGSFSVWGQGAFRQFNGQDEDALTLRAEVTTGMLGADYRWSTGWLAGVLFAHSRGDGSFEMKKESGEIMSALTGIYPYVSYTRTGWEVWASAGAGRGNAEGVDMEGGLISRFGALGMRGTLVSGGTNRLNYHSDILVTDAEIKEHDITAEVYRIRAGLEASTQITGGIRPYVEANVRQDGGSAETGTGLELGGGVRFANPTWHLRGEVRTQGLVMHTADGFTEWGFSGSLQMGSYTEGLMMRLRPSWGRGQGMSMYRQQTILDAAPVGANVHRTELELGYGIPWKEGTARSVAGMTQLSQGRMYRLGGELRPWERLSFSVYGLAHGHETALRDIGVNVQGTLRY